MRQRAAHPRVSEDAVGQVLAFMVAGVLFVGAIGALLLVSTDTGNDAEPAQAAERSVQAVSLIDLLVGSPGIGWAGGADSISRLGIQASNGTGLALSSMDKLRGASYEANDDNDRVDYEEALASLGIRDGTRFHLRIYPVGLDSVYEDTLVGTRVAYIADWVTLPPITVADGSDEAMIADANSQFNMTAAPDTTHERQAILDLGLAYNDLVHITTLDPTVLVGLPLLPDPPLTTYMGEASIPGDVYPDDKLYLNAVLAGRLAEYDVLVIGSGIDHSALTSDAVKGAIKEWVLDGGTLMVMGSSAQSTQWMQPLFSVGITTVNGGAFAPDISHPLLHEPNTLNWEAYENYGQGWDIKSTGSGAHYNDFTHVVVEGGEDVLAVSNDGAFGDGRIFLTSYRPREIAAEQGIEEAMYFLGNMFLFAEQDHLYLEYGPQVPDGVSVATAVRQSNVWDSKLGNVALRIELHAWQEAPDV